MGSQNTAVSSVGLAIRLVALAALSACTASPGGTPLMLQTSPASRPVDVGRYGVFELSVTSDEKLDNPFWDASLQAEFTAPGGRKVRLGGFYYGGTEWRARFVPDEVGRWTYSATLTGKRQPVRQDGEFTCVASDRHGFVRVSKRNPYRFEYDDGTPFYPIGTQRGGLLQSGHDGPPAAPGVWRNAPLEQILKDFDGAVNLNRFPLSVGKRHGMSVSFVPENGPLDRYDLKVAADLDAAFALSHQYKVAQMLVLFQDMSMGGKFVSGFGDIRDTSNYKSLTAGNLTMQERYLRYVVARYGAYVDVWELFNEDSYAPDDYLAHLAKVVRDADPYRHPITTNYERPDQPWCEIVCPHEYMSMPARDFDGALVNDWVRLKSFGKPVQYTEFGNKAVLSNDEPDKWRIAVWTAFTREVHMLFWNQSGSRTVPRPDPRNEGNSNTYLGPETREHFRILRQYTDDLPVTLRPILTGWGNRDANVRVGGVGDADHAIVYLHHYTSHDTEAQPKTLYIKTTPGRFHLRWIDPASGKVVEESDASTRHQILTISRPPPVKVDLALRIDRIEGATTRPLPTAPADEE